MISVLFATFIFSIILTLALLIESIIFLVQTDGGYTMDSSRIIRYFILIWITSTVGYYFVDFILHMDALNNII